MTGWRHRIGGPRAVSLAAWLWMLPWTVWLTFAFNPDPVEEMVLAWLGVALIGHLAAGLVLAASWWTWLTTSHTSAHPWRALVTYALAGVAMTMTAGTAGTLLDLTAEPALAYRGIVGAVLATAWLATVTALIAGRRQQRKTTTELRRRRHQLGTLRNDPHHAMEIWHGATLDEIRRLVSQELVRIRRVVGPAPADDATAARAAAQLEAIIREVVRPLCRRLAAADELVPVATIGLDRTGIDTTAEPPAWDHLAPESWRDRLRTFAEDVTAARPLVRLPAPVASGVLIIVGLAAAATGGSLALQIPMVPLPPAQLFFASTVSLMVLFALSANLTALHHAGQRNEHGLRAVMDVLDIEISRLRRRAGVTQRRMARFVHGDIQSRIVAVITQFKRPRSPHPRVLLDHLKDSCERALASIEASDDHASRLRAVTGLWRAVIDTSVVCDPATYVAFNRDQLAAEDAVTIVQEALMNAAHHGRAQTVTVTIGVTGSAAQVMVRDDGVAPVGDFRPGIGTQLFDELASSWRLTDLGDGRQFEAIVPVKPSIQP